MKILYVAAALSALSCSRAAEKCECAGYFDKDINEEKKIYTIPDGEIESCDRTEDCIKRCEGFFNKLTNYGDLDKITSKGIPVSALACRNYNADIQDALPGGYWRACGGDWEFVRAANGSVCCQGDQEIPCQGPVKCECAGFFDKDVNDEKKIYTIPDGEIESCRERNACSMRCETLFNRLTNHGDLNKITSKGITVSALACRNYNADIQNAVPGAYWRACGTSWALVEQARGMVCCAGDQEVKCQ